MPKFFVPAISGEEVLLEGETARHISRSLRMKVGDMLSLSDGSGVDFGCAIAAMDGETVRLKVCYSAPSESEPDIQVTLYQGVPKGDKMEDIIQKTVELGVSKIVPVLTKRSVSRPDQRSAAKKRERYQKIALEAAKQSGRGIIPSVEDMVRFDQAISLAGDAVKLLCYEGGGAPFQTVIGASKGQRQFALFIGPEGGFEPEEAEAVLAAGGLAVTLGKRILRTQTAPVAALTALMLLTNNLE